MYNVLITKDDGKWSIQFGSWDRDDVTFEYQHEFRDYKRKDKKIFTLDTDEQKEIDKKVEWYNEHF